MTKKIYFWGIGIALAAVLLFFVLNGSSASGFEAVNNFDGEINIYTSQSCGCCSVYANYFQRKGNSRANIVNLDNVESIKSRYGVPKQLESCHTTIIGDYFVEGHIPLDAVEKLLNEKPDIKGIAMPGMPMGSPGMPGSKTDDFVIYAVDRNGEINEFMRL